MSAVQHYDTDIRAEVEYAVTITSDPVERWVSGCRWQWRIRRIGIGGGWWSEKSGYAFTRRGAKRAAARAVRRTEKGRPDPETSIIKTTRRDADGRKYKR